MYEKLDLATKQAESMRQKFIKYINNLEDNHVIALNDTKNHYIGFISTLKKQAKERLTLYKSVLNELQNHSKLEQIQASEKIKSLSFKINELIKDKFHLIQLPT